MAKFFFFSFVFFFFVLGGARAYDVFNVLDHGATGNGLTDDSQAFNTTFTIACNSPSPSATILVPGGKSFLLQPMHFHGEHCNPSNINFQIDGNLVAPSDPKEWHQCDGEKCHAWLEFQHFNGLYIHGSGSFNGRGRNWWNPACHKQNIVCGKKPTGMIISHSNDVHVIGLTFKDSPQMHIAFEECTGVYVSQVNIRAPSESPNTDGIHIQHSSNVFIDHSFIGTGDDCVSIGDGSSHLKIFNVACGPGHGISVGSLGKHGEKNTVEHVHVRNVKFTGTQNGVRIKTWQGGKGYAKNMMFENIISNGARYPIIIDQYYCDHDHCKNQTSAVHVNNITYQNIVGTSEKEIAVSLACSKSTPCKNIVMKNIILKPTSKGEKKFKETSSFCFNVHGRSNGKVFPKVPCLSLDKSL